MKPAPFDYVRPTSVSEAIEALAEGGSAARVLAGGQSLIPAMNFRLAQPSMLVDLAGLQDLRGIRLDGDRLRIGAMTRQRDVELSAEVREHAPLLAGVMPWVAHPQIRNRGTIGGSLPHADPAAELPAVMLALEAMLTAQGPSGTRRIAATEFYTGLFETSLEPDELLIEVDVPVRTSTSRWAFEEVSRRHGDFALAGVAISLSKNEQGSVSDVRIALLSVADGPVLSEAGANLLVNESLDDARIDAVADATALALDPPGDIHASADFRRHLARVLTRRALHRLRA
jgi:carbon-monoxide dehydrogenase medium subunit